MDIFILLALLISLLGTASIYLASPNQRWRPAPLPACSARIFGVIFLTMGLAFLLNALQAAAAFFVFIHWLMLLFVLFPYFGALLATRRKVHP